MVRRFPRGKEKAHVCFVDPTVNRARALRDRDLLPPQFRRSCHLSRPVKQGVFLRITFYERRDPVYKSRERFL